ncbi:UDP-glucose 4-epimerase GalE [Mycobacterium sp. 155]|uniref:UDP-glucose 4-epimerase GalE n=1 Tax=Mycobacterium sp. 155 TaxID=1157943 RepID=UPI000380A9FB|nr:UDP-glucose 4-epimerase GalE [Mycobacterium sp. 155]
MTVLVTGGAGYIGAHVVRSLQQDGHDVVVVDDLSTGLPVRLSTGVPLQVGSVLDTDLLVRVMREFRVDSVIHLAGKKAVEESMAKPLFYHHQNVVGMHNLLVAMVDAGVHRLVFSSSAAVYGTPLTDDPVTEASPTQPESPYGRTKLMGEQMIQDAAIANPISWASLRYFNVAGAGDPTLADRGANNLIPKIFRAIDNGAAPQIYGGDHPTPDGTCIRDYIHVQDLAEAHACVLRQMAHEDIAATYNVGTGAGVSVLEVMHAVRQAIGRDFNWAVTDRRPGDPPQVVANPAKISNEVGWHAHHDLESIVTSAWKAWDSQK